MVTLRIAFDAVRTEVYVDGKLMSWQIGPAYYSFIPWVFYF
jgi:hypothetical protein